MMKTFLCEHKYILLPVRYEAEEKRLIFRADGQPVLDLVIRLDPDHPDVRFPVDIERFKGKTITLEAAPACDFPLETRDAISFPPDGAYRPFVHFTASRGWINDPNGLAYVDGRYVMYFQHNPVAVTWENMHWGLAESTDLIHWQEKGDVLFPDTMGTMFSGSGYVDVNNVSGLGRDGKAPLLCFYTAAGDTSETSRGSLTGQCLAYSNDGGRTLTKYARNPLIPQIEPLNRDPKVIPYPQDHSFILAMFLIDHAFALFKSSDLLNWREIQRLELPDDAECPDFYPLTDPDGREKWIFTAASDRYVIGTFDGQRFTPETEQLRLNWGDTSYAAQSWSELPDGRRVRTAFAHAAPPDMPFSNCMILPQQMTLRLVNGDLRLCAEPVAELEQLVTDTKAFSGLTLTKDTSFVTPLASPACDMILTAALDASFAITLYGLTIRYDAEHRQICCNERSAPVQGREGMITLRVISDTLLTELFTDEGSVFMGLRCCHDQRPSALTITAENAVIASLRVSALRAYWDD